MNKNFTTRLNEIIRVEQEKQAKIDAKKRKAEEEKKAKENERLRKLKFVPFNLRTSSRSLRKAIKRDMAFSGNASMSNLPMSNL